ncbi:MAG: GNAT family N-acetyltransferase [bacterium]|nr:GNAT family N-acetyltransferase [bacterium]
MKIIDLTEEHLPHYFLCLEEWSDDIKDAGNHKEVWYHRMEDKGLRVKLALDDSGVIGGMIQYVPIEHSMIEGKDLFFILCIWVHGHKKGRGNFQKRGMGKALLQAAEEDVKALGAKGIAAWGLRLPIWMKASWFKRHGYKVVDNRGLQSLLWKPFKNDAIPPRWIRPKGKPSFEPGRVTVTAYCNGWCPAMNLAFERARRAASEFGEKVNFRAVDTFDRQVLLDCGQSDAVFVNDKQIRTGPPPSYEKIRKIIEKQVKKCQPGLNQK